MRPSTFRPKLRRAYYCTVSLTVIEREMVPAVPVTVMAYVPCGVPSVREVLMSDTKDSQSLELPGKRLRQELGKKVVIVGF
jgi:hypothetical protein